MTPLPESVDATIRLNAGDQVGTGATEAPPGAELKPLPTTIDGPTQVVIWFRMDRVGVRYSSPDVVIHYSIGEDSYEASFPIGVTVCAVQRVQPRNACTSP